MLKTITKYILVLLMIMACAAQASATNDASGKQPADTASAVVKTEKEEAKINPKEIIFEHLGDGYGWEAPFNHHVRIPLPVIVFASDGIHIFSSTKLEHGAVYTDGKATFMLAGKESKYHGKVIEIKDGKELRPFDISITKNVAAIIICLLIVLGMMLWLKHFYKKHPLKAPRKGLGAIEALMMFIYDSVIKSTLGNKARKFAPYLLTVFFFIFIMNLTGLVVIFPGGANLTGNIAVTLVLAILTFLVTNIFGNRHYWKEIFWPDVPLWLKFPLPIMPMIEIFGMFTKPAALTVRLFANMMGGHMIVLVLTLLIFIFAAVSPVVGGVTSVVSVLFSVFMLLIDVLVSFIQAYVFTMLSTIFISLANEERHEHNDAQADQPDTQTEANGKAKPATINS